MNPLQKLIRKYINPDRELGHHMRPYGATYLPSGIASYDHYRNDYENGYSSIRVIASRFARIEPFTIDGKGNQVASNVLDRLYTPNTAMSAYDFREALAVMSLVHDKVYIRPHHTGVRLNANSLTGFTFLEAVTEEIVDGRVRYKLPNGDVLTTEQVMVLKSINPYNLNDGFSSAHAARRWTRLDDLIADYQAGFFENGTVPAGQFTITAKTKADFEDMAANIRAHHRGAGKNNNVMFAHRPTDAMGKPVESQIEWQPFNTNNKDLALKDLFEQANQKIDSTYGVPASLRGVNDANTYASVRVDKLIFQEETLDPFALKVWSKFNHELNRITGGLGVAISYKLEPVVLADEEKVKSESKQIDAQTVIALTDKGYTLESAVAYIKTGDISALVKPAKPDERPEVLNAEEARNTPEQPVDPANPTSKALSPADRTRYESRVAAIVREALERQTDAAAELVKSKAISEDQPVDPEEDELLYEALAATLLAAVNYQGPIEHAANIRLMFEAGINVDGVGPFILTREQQTTYQALLQKIARDVNATTAVNIRNVLEQGRLTGASAAEIRAQLKGLVQEWRVTQIARTEVNRAGNEASLYSMESIARETGAEVNKVWAHSGGDAPCEYCAALVGRKVPLNDAFVPLDSAVHGTEGGRYENSFTDLHSGGLHPNCHCRQTYEVAA